MYEESMRTPLVMRLPAALGYKRRGDVTTLVQNIDYAPPSSIWRAYLSLAIYRGISLRRLLLANGKEPDLGRKALYYHFYEYPRRACCTPSLRDPYDALQAHALLRRYR